MPRKRTKSRGKRTKSRRFSALRRRFSRSFNWITPTTGVVAGVNSSVGKDIAYAQTTGQWSKFDIVGKLSFIGSKIAGRVLGMSWDVKQKDGGVCPIVQPATFNLGGIANQWTGMGILAALYKKYGDGMPFRKEVGQASKGFLAGGIMGVIDPPPMQTAGMNASIERSIESRGSLYS